MVSNNMAEGEVKIRMRGEPSSNKDKEAGTEHIALLAEKSHDRRGKTHMRLTLR